MGHERLAALILLYRVELAAHPEASTPYEAILGIFQALDKAEISAGQALRLLRYQATRQVTKPAHAALYRQAAAVIRQMQREEHEQE